MPLDPTTLLGSAAGEYTLDSLIGSGTFAWVFRATGPAGTPAAVKILRPRYAGDAQFETRFRNEFEVARQLEHRSIIKILSVGQDRDLTYFVMDYCVESLEERVAGSGPLADPELISVASQMASALSFAHQSNVIHRDIKPDNILFHPSGDAVLADFGIARVVSGFVAATGANMTIGTPHYISPEQAQGRTLDGRADLYSLGVTLYRASTGSLPFRSTDWFELARMHVEDPPTAPRDLRSDMSERLERIILKLMAKHPDDRYQSAEALSNDLDDIRRHSRATRSFGSDIAERTVGATKPMRRWVVWVAAILIVIAAAAAVVAVGSR